MSGTQRASHKHCAPAPKGNRVVAARLLRAGTPYKPILEHLVVTSVKERFLRTYVTFGMIMDRLLIQKGGASQTKLKK